MTTSYRSAAKIASDSAPDFKSSRSCTTLCHGVQANFAISLLLGYYHVYYHYGQVITTILCITNRVSKSLIYSKKDIAQRFGSLQFTTTFPPHSATASPFADDLPFGFELIQYYAHHVSRHMWAHALQFYHAESIWQMPNRLQHHFGLCSSRHGQETHTLFKFAIGRNQNTEEILGPRQQCVVAFMPALGRLLQRVVIALFALLNKHF